MAAGEQAPFAWEQYVDKPTLDVHVANARRARICLDDLRLEGSFVLPPAAGGAVAGTSPETLVGREVALQRFAPAQASSMTALHR